MNATGLAWSVVRHLAATLNTVHLDIRLVHIEEHILSLRATAQGVHGRVLQQQQPVERLFFATLAAHQQRVLAALPRKPTLVLAGLDDRYCTKARPEQPCQRCHVADSQDWMCNVLTSSCFLRAVRLAV